MRNNNENTRIRTSEHASSWPTTHSQSRVDEGNFVPVRHQECFTASVVCPFSFETTLPNPTIAFYYLFCEHHHRIISHISFFFSSSFLTRCSRITLLNVCLFVYFIWFAPVHAYMHCVNWQVLRTKDNDLYSYETSHYWVNEWMYVCMNQEDAN